MAIQPFRISSQNNPYESFLGGAKGMREMQAFPEMLEEQRLKNAFQQLQNQFYPQAQQSQFGLQNAQTQEIQYKLQHGLYGDDLTQFFKFLQNQGVPQQQILNMLNGKQGAMGSPGTPGTPGTPEIPSVPTMPGKVGEGQGPLSSLGNANRTMPTMPGQSQDMTGSMPGMPGNMEIPQFPQATTQYNFQSPSPIQAAFNRKVYGNSLSPQQQIDIEVEKERRKAELGMTTKQIEKERERWEKALVSFEPEEEQSREVLNNTARLRNLYPQLKYKGADINKYTGRYSGEITPESLSGRAGNVFEAWAPGGRPYSFGPEKQFDKLLTALQGEAVQQLPGGAVTSFKLGFVKDLKPERIQDEKSLYETLDKFDLAAKRKLEGIQFMRAADELGIDKAKADTLFSEFQDEFPVIDSKGIMHPENIGRAQEFLQAFKEGRYIKKTREHVTVKRVDGKLVEQ